MVRGESRKKCDRCARVFWLCNYAFLPLYTNTIAYSNCSAHCLPTAIRRNGRIRIQVASAISLRGRMRGAFNDCRCQTLPFLCFDFRHLDRDTTAVIQPLLQPPGSFSAKEMAFSGYCSGMLQSNMFENMSPCSFYELLYRYVIHICAILPHPHNSKANRRVCNLFNALRKITDFGLR